MNVINIDKKQLEKVIKLSNLVGRYSELERQASFLSSTKAEARKAILKRQIKELLDKPSADTKVVRLQISIPAEELESKKQLSIKDLLSSLSDKGQKVTFNNEEEELFGILSSEYPNVFQYMLK